jgi:hypothetical protein
VISLRSRGRGMCTRLFCVPSRSFRVHYTPACLKITNEISNLGALPGPTSRGGGGPKVKNLCARFRCFVSFIPPVVLGKNKSNPSRKEMARMASS